MLTTNYTSLTEILERVRRDFGFEDIYYDEAKEWVWDVIGFMGTPEMLRTETQLINIRNWRGELPVNVYDLKDHILRDTRNGQIMTYAENVFHKSDTSKELKTIGLIQGESVIYDEDRKSVGTRYTSIVDNEYESEDTDYKIKDYYIFTALKEMEVELSYTAFPMDLEKLEPLIPDDPKVIRAVVYYLAERNAMRLMLNDKLSERKYEMINQQYLFNVGAAITKARISSVPQFENLKNRTLAILKDIHPYRRGFKN